MKAIITSAVLLIMLTATATAQDTQTRIKIKQTDVPVSVVESFTKDFSDGIAEEWDIVPAVIVVEDYEVLGNDNSDGTKTTEYSVSIKGPKVKGEAIYDQDGKLKYSKEVIKNAALPAAVRNSIVNKYPGFSFMKDQETIKEGRSNFIHYRIVIEKGKEKVCLAVDASGKILKERKLEM